MQIMKFVCRSFMLSLVLFLVLKTFLSNWLSDQVSNMDINEADEASRLAAGPKRSVGVDENNQGAYFLGSKIPDDMLAMKRLDYLPDYKNPCWYETSQAVNSPPVKKLRCLPYFHIIGVDKSGTSDLWFRVAAHPDIVKPNAIMDKETHWWSWRRFGFNIWTNNGKIHHFDWYLQNFDRPAQQIEQTVSTLGKQKYHHLITGEGSPTIFWDFTGWNLIPQNKNRSVEQAYLTPHFIKHLTPDVKLILIFRNPTERMYSDYLFLDNFRAYHNVSAGNFHKEVLRSIAMLDDCLAKRSQLECFYSKELHMRIPVRIVVGMYDIFLKEWLKVFPRDQILILRNEDYSKDIKSHIKRVFDFLQLRPLSEKELADIESRPRVYERSSNTKSLGPMMPETRLVLNQFYSKFNKQLAETLNDSKYLWDENH